MSDVCCIPLYRIHGAVFMRRFWSNKTTEMACGRGGRRISWQKSYLTCNCLNYQSYWTRTSSDQVRVILLYLIVPIDRMSVIIDIYQCNTIYYIIWLFDILPNSFFLIFMYTCTMSVYIICKINYDAFYSLCLLEE